MAFAILGESRARFAVSGFFLNLLNFPLGDSAGVYHGFGQCEHCRGRLGAATGLALPRAEDWSDPAYLRWREWSRGVVRDLSGHIRDFVAARNPEAGIILAQNAHVLFQEVNNAVDRPLPLWRHWAGEFSREVRTAYPDTPAVVNSVMFLDLPYRFTAEQPGLLALSLAQTIAQGVNPYAYVVGTTRNQPDRKNFGVVRQLLTFHREHAAVYVGLRSAAKVALVSSTRSQELAGRASAAPHGSDGLASVLHARRGAYRALVERQVPFDILPDSQLVPAAADGRLARYAALVLPNVAVLDDDQVATLDAYVAAGGGLVATYETGRYRPDGSVRDAVPLASLGVARVLSRRAAPPTIGVADARGIERPLRSAYLRVTRREDLPGCDDTDLVMLDRAFLTVEPRGAAVPSLALVPRSRNGPPELAYIEQETAHPGLLHYAYGRGRSAYFPWPIDWLFFDHSLPEHRTLLVQAVATVAGGRQVVTDAPPQVEVVLSRQPGGAYVVHLINHSGHQDRSFHDPLPIFGLALSLALEAVPAATARALVSGDVLPVRVADGRAQLRLRRLDAFEALIVPVAPEG